MCREGARVETILRRVYRTDGHASQMDGYRSKPVEWSILGSTTTGSSSSSSAEQLIDTVQYSTVVLRRYLLSVVESFKQNYLHCFFVEHRRAHAYKKNNLFGNA